MVYNRGIAIVPMMTALILVASSVNDAQQHILTPVIDVSILWHLDDWEPGECSISACKTCEGENFFVTIYLCYKVFPPFMCIWCMPWWRASY